MITKETLAKEARVSSDLYK
jgi:hypothetical protein